MAVETEDGVQILDRAGRTQCTIPKQGIRSLLSSRGSDVVMFTANAAWVYDSAGREKASLTGLTDPYPVLGKGALVAVAEMGTLRDPLCRVTALTEDYAPRARFSLPRGFQLLDAKQGLAVVAGRQGEVPGEPESLSIWRSGEKIRDLDVEGGTQRLAVHPVPYGGPIYIWREREGRQMLLAVGLGGETLWSFDLAKAGMKHAEACASATDDALALWGGVGGRQQGETYLYLLDGARGVRAKRAFRSIRAVEFDPSGRHLIVATPGSLHALRSADGATIWEERANTLFYGSRPFVFGQHGGTPHLAFACIERRPDPRKDEAGQTALEVRELATGRVLARVSVHGAGYLVRKLSDDKLLLRAGSRALLAELLR